MFHNYRGSVWGLRLWLAPVILLSLVALSGPGRLQAEGPCDLQANDIKPLIEILRNKELQKKDPDRVKRAITRLGERRCAAAADDLAALLPFKYHFDWEGTAVRLQPIFTATRYPAIGALAQIGEAALPSLVRGIETNLPNSPMTRNATYTVKLIFRDHPDKAEGYLVSAAATVTTPEYRSRLKQAAATLPSISIVDVKRYKSPAPH